MNGLRYGRTAASLYSRHALLAIGAPLDTVKELRRMATATRVRERDEYIGPVRRDENDGLGGHAGRSVHGWIIRINKLPACEFGPACL